MIVFECANQSLVQFAIEVLAMTFKLSVNEVAFVFDVASLGVEDALSRLLSFFEVTDVLKITKLPFFRTFAIL